MSSLALKDCVSRFLAWCELNRRPATVRSYRYQLERFARWFGDRPITDLTPAAVTSFSRSFHPVQSLQRLCNWCCREERSLRVNPLQGMPKPKMGARRRVLDRGQVVKMIRGADACFRPFLVFLRETIARPQEVRSLTWGDIEGADRWKSSDDFLRSGGSHFSLPTGKGFEYRRDDAAERIIPISPRLRRLLERLARRCESLSTPILRDSKGGAWSKESVRCRIRRLRVRVGLVADRRGERVVAYTFRHTSATNAVAAGVRDFLLAEVMGHSTTRTTARYVHLRPADLVDGMKRVWEAKPRSNPENDAPRSSRNASD
jgi:integrase